MSTDLVEANLELVPDWIDALRRGAIDSIAERFHPNVGWEDVSGSVACEGRDEVLAWLRASPSSPHQVDALELVANRDHVVLGVHDPTRQELAGVQLDGRLFTVFTVSDGQIVHLRDHAHRSEALSDAGLEYEWR
jgi:ketosteroid isomerase-like protein